MVNNFTIKTVNTKEIKQEPQEAHIDEFEGEKVEVLIKEVIRINPRDFSAFKHALEDFVKQWDK